jgi:hypothetical protein
MPRVVVPAVTALLVLACGGANLGPWDEPGSTGSVTPAAKKFVEGQDYVVLERLRVIDPTGFAQPMEAYSILVPRGWKSEGGITWQVGNPCMVEAIHNRVKVKSPDGAWVLDLYPAKQWDWWDDPMMLQTQVQQAQNPVFRRCPIARPMDAGQYLQGPMAQEAGAQVVSVEPNEQIGQVLRQQAQQANQTYQQAGVALESRPSAAMATLRYPDGSAGVAIAAIDTLVSFMPDYMTGGQSASYSCKTTTAVSLRHPAGQEPEARKLLSTVMSSFRINPDWQAGVQKMVMNVAAMEQRETQKRAAIQHEVMEYSAQLQQRTWEEGQASRDRIAESWGQTLRGVETWNDASGGGIELSAGYDEAWSRPDGTYILSNDPMFDPNVAFQEDWRKLEKGR